MSKLFTAFYPISFKRWLPSLVLVLLLHLMLIQLALSPLVLPALGSSEPQIVTADLNLAPILPVTAEIPAPTKPAPNRKKAPAAQEVAEPEPSDAPVKPAAASEKATDVESKPADLPPPAPTLDASKQALSLGPLPQYRVNPPPSAELKFRAHSQHKGQDIYGSGRIAWRSSNNAFKVTGEFSVLFFSLLNFTSEGTVDPQYGISPTVYAEKRMRRSETNTHFHRERNTISFSASALKYQRQGGEQDRASVVWQLSGIGRHDSQRFAPGASIDIAVAGSRAADVWKFRVGQLEEIETDAGKMRAWRVTRTPRKDSFEQTFDVWLAPQLEWYPVKLRYTNANGDFLDLTLTEIAKAP